MAIEFRQLHYVLAAHQHRSFRQAAVSLQLKQSTLSRQIHQLEADLGVQLFERHSGGVTPTAAGKDFLRIAQHISDEFDALMSLARSDARADTGRLRIGFYLSLSSGDLSNLLRKFSDLHPNVEIAPVEEARTKLIGDVQGGLLDCTIVSGSGEAAGLAHMPLWKEGLVAALPSAHRLAGAEAVTWDDLRSERFLITKLDPGPELHDIAIAELARPGDRPQVLILDVARETLLGLTSGGKGVAITTKSATGLIYPGVTFVGLQSLRAQSGVLQMAYWRASNENPALTAFVRLLEGRFPTVE